ncbi:MAG: FISUMP domain-containing protein [Bacilli bacterium]|jgi:uncharacterized protein (TIGR02145 family)
MLDEEEPSLLETLKVSSLEDMLKISDSNYLSIDISFDRYLNPFIKLVGKDKWEGLTACGTSNDLKIGSDIDCEVPPFPAILPDGQLCGSIFYDFRDGNKYKTVQIGKQCWFGENLRYTGSGCLVEPPEEWLNSLTACTFITRKDIINTSSNFPWLIGEILYQWGAAMDGGNEGARGLCPVGWHIPTDKEWVKLESFVDSKVECDENFFLNSYYNRGFDVGKKLKAKTTKWIFNNNGNGDDSFGFRAIPAGFRGSYGYVGFGGMTAYFWTSSFSIENPNEILYRSIDANFDTVGRFSSSELDLYGLSLRCLLNEE